MLRPITLRPFLFVAVTAVLLTTTSSSQRRRRPHAASALAAANNNNNNDIKRPVVTSTAIPPLVDVPVWSLATLNEDGTTNFNILTYATPVSVRPDRLYALGLYKQTLSYENYCRLLLSSEDNKDEEEEGACRKKCAVLQLLTADHIPFVRLFGGQSGHDVRKEEECATIGGDDFSLQDIGKDLPKVLPGCAHYLELSPWHMGTEMDADDSSSSSSSSSSSHAVAICKVEEMWLPNGDYVANSKEYLSSGRLRELGIITEQGRIAD